MSAKVRPHTLQKRPPTGILRMRLPATSANLGPGFDAVAVALDFFLEIEARTAQEFSVTATGRDADRCARINDNLILETYKQLLRDHRRPIVPVAIRMRNEIPLGMGCGSSAAARLAGIALARHFGRLAWSTDRVLEEAYTLEETPAGVRLVSNNEVSARLPGLGSLGFIIARRDISASMRRMKLLCEE